MDMNTDIGWIKLPRNLRESEMYQNMTGIQRSILVDIMFLVNWKPRVWEYKGITYRLEAGEMVTSLEKLRAQLANDVTNQNLRTTLKILKNYGFLTNHSTKQGRTISICKWKEIQGDLTNELTNNLTKSSQRANKELTNNLTTIEEERNKESKKGKSNNTLAEVSHETPTSDREEFLKGMKEDTRQAWLYWESVFSEITTSLEENRSAINKLLALDGKEKYCKLVNLAARSWGESYVPKEVKASSPAALWSKRGSLLAWGKGRFTQTTTPQIQKGVPSV